MSSSIDISTTGVEKLAHNLEKTVRDLVGCENVTSIEADTIRALAADRDSYRFSKVPSRDFVVTDEIVDYILRYGGRCRDCADEDGVCPNSGLPCENPTKTIRFVLNALAYGLNHGFLKPRP